MKQMRFPSLAGLALLASLPIVGPAHAQVGADLNISPKRVVFQGAQNSSTVFVYNRGGSAVSYKIELIDRVMTPDGQIRAADELAKTADGANAWTNFAFFDGHVSLYPTEPYSRRQASGGNDNALIDYWSDTIFYLKNQR